MTQSSKSDTHRAATSQTTYADEATTVCTTQSPLSRNNHTHNNILALEETLQRQQQEIRNMLNRFDAMDTKMEHLKQDMQQ